MRKKLLSEAQVRRFQSLASIKPLNEMDSSYKKHDDDDKVEETYDDKAHMKDDTMEEMAYKKEDEKMEALYEEEDEMDMDDDDEMMGEADVELDEELVDQFMDAVKTIEQVADALSGAVGDDLDMDDEDMKMDMDADEPAPEMKASPDEDEDEEEMLEEALRGISYVPSQKEIVSTVAKRVAKRLQEAKRAEARLNRALGKKR